ncbi:MAG: outer membrane beta-barrel protein [Deltaproteobacteria bacterium]|nr:outer membrane beta-barrel protein [Deltaproteobacteria bacterium]
MTVLAGAALLMPTFGSAEGFYLGAQGGASYAHDICDDSGGFSCDDDGIAAGVIVGYEVNEILSLEGGYRYFDEYEMSGFVPLLGNTKLTFEAQSLELVAVAKMPTQGMVSPYVRGGLLVSDIEIKVSSSSLGSGSESDTEADVIVGAGISIRPSPQHEFRLSYDFVPDLGIEIGGEDAETNMSQLMVGYFFHF